MRRISRNHVGRDSKKNCEKNCVWHSPIIGDGVGMLKPPSIAHAQPVVPAQYFVPYYLRVNTALAGRAAALGQCV